MGKRNVTHWTVKDAEDLCAKKDGVFRVKSDGTVLVVWGEDLKVQDAIQGQKNLKVRP